MGIDDLTGLRWDRCPCAYLGHPGALAVWQWVAYGLPTTPDDTHEWIALTGLATRIRRLQAAKEKK